MRPETWLPTCTVTSADSAPVAVTRPTTSPRSTRDFSRWKADLCPPKREPKATHPPPKPTTARRPTNTPTRRLT